MELGNKIYEHRKKLGLSQEQLAEKIGVSRQTISKWELGETSPDIKQAQMLSQIFNVSLDELTGNDTKEVIYEKVSNTEKLAGLIIKILKVLGNSLIAFLILSVIMIALGIASFSNLREEGIVEAVAWTEDLGEDTYTIELRSDGNVEITGPSEEIKEDIMELVVVGDINKSESNITEYFIKLREETEKQPDK